LGAKEGSRFPLPPTTGRATGDGVSGPARPLAETAAAEPRLPGGDATGLGSGPGCGQLMD